MSYYTPFYSFFDAINDEVDAFNRMLDSTAGYYEPVKNSSAPSISDGKAGGANDRTVARAGRAGSGQVSKAGGRGARAGIPGFGALDRWFDNDPFTALARPFDMMPVPVDIYDHDKNYELKVSVPGVKDKKDINLEYHQNKNQIVVSGEVPTETNEKNKDNLKLQERAFGKFKRVVTLPESPEIDADNIKADYTNGVLTLTVPKLEPTKDGKPNVHKIEISSQESYSS